MSTLEARIAEVLEEHFASNSPRDHTPHCQCGWKGAAGLGLFDFDASHKEALAHQAAMLAPVIREVWDEGWDAGWINAWDNAKSASNKVTTSPNPYKEEL